MQDKQSYLIIVTDDKVVQKVHEFYGTPEDAQDLRASIIQALYSFTHEDIQAEMVRKTRPKHRSDAIVDLMTHSAEREDGPRVSLQFKHYLYVDHRPEETVQEAIYPVLSLDYDDIRDAGYDGVELTHGDMKTLAERIADAIGGENWSETIETFFAERGIYPDGADQSEAWADAHVSSDAKGKLVALNVHFSYFGDDGRRYIITNGTAGTVLSNIGDAYLVDFGDAHGIRAIRFDLLDEHFAD